MKTYKTLKFNHFVTIKKHSQKSRSDPLPRLNHGPSDDRRSDFGEWGVKRDQRKIISRSCAHTHRPVPRPHSVHKRNNNKIPKTRLRSIISKRENKHIQREGEMIAERVTHQHSKKRVRMIAAREIICSRRTHARTHSHSLPCQEEEGKIIKFTENHQDRINKSHSWFRGGRKSWFPLGWFEVWVGKRKREEKSER